MDITSGTKTQGAVTFTISRGNITAMHVGVSVEVSGNGSKCTLGTSVDVWPLLTKDQRQEMGSIKDVIDQAVKDL